MHGGPCSTARMPEMPTLSPSTAHSQPGGLSPRVVLRQVCGAYFVRSFTWAVPIQSTHTSYSIACCQRNARGETPIVARPCGRFSPFFPPPLCPCAAMRRAALPCPCACGVGTRAWPCGPAAGLHDVGCSRPHRGWGHGPGVARTGEGAWAMLTDHRFA